MPAPAKKLIVVLMEGKTDRTSLGLILDEAFRTMGLKVVTLLLEGDCTAQKQAWNTASKNYVIKQIGDEVSGYLNAHHLNRDQDVAGILQITDSDGAFVPDDQIVRRQNSTRTRYDAREGRIMTSRKDLIERRNLDKRKTLEILVERESVLGVPYRIVYLSCNLEHVLHNNPNTPRQRKVEQAREFQGRCMRDPGYFQKLLLDSDLTVPGTYFETWDYLRDPKYPIRSLSRCTNLPIAWEDPTWLKRD